MISQGCLSVDFPFLHTRPTFAVWGGVHSRCTALSADIVRLEPDLLIYNDPLAYVELILN